MSSIIVLLTLVISCLAKTVTYDFDIGWVLASPDGYTRPVIGINGQWPIPTIEANEGDTIVVNAKNSLGNETTSLHFHGMSQQGTGPSDGPVGVTQCSIPPGSSFTYQFTATPAGTHWYHSHDHAQYPDGLRGQMIIHDPIWEASLGVDQQIHFSISDWYHNQMPGLLHTYLSPNNPTGELPSPDSFLVNDSSTAPTLNFLPGKKYLLRIVSVSALACGSIQFQGHQMIVVGIDGVEVYPETTDAITICAGQRYNVVIVGQSNPSNSFSYLVKMSTTMLTTIPSNMKTEVQGTISYTIDNILKPLISSSFSNSTLSDSTTLDDMTLKPLDNQLLLNPVGQSIDLYVNQTYYPGIGSRISLGSQPWVEPKVPSLYTALSTGESASDPAVYGPGVSPYVLSSGSIVQVVLTNPEAHPHPMHMHGHEFQVIARGSGTWDGNTNSLPIIPMKRDVVLVPANGYFVLRFRANNPGVWFFHCHIDWHLAAGMAATFIEAPDQLQKLESIPLQGASICTSQGYAASGNCAGVTTTSDITSNANCNTIFNTNTDGYVNALSPYVS
ncbi:multicopper oxidase [Lepidopterella palustris CBS 459.81]|uniref:Multicopper oxidase n=1 Tax=Lepidopterella palustris CBS 459.81 TaxID=1314670 RepID=A0A8E2E9W0_9PEZI|nr:multicopper oxidase [Lepidopterella palustris CBS 459.81]